MKPRNHGADRALRERVDRVDHAGAGQERAEERERRTRAIDEHHVPDLQHPSLLLDHHRVQERRRREPRHQRRVLDRVPGVVAAPADLDVRPVGSEQLADAERTSTRRASSGAWRRSSARRCGPTAARPSRTRTAPSARRSRGRAAAGARPCTGSGGSGRARAVGRRGLRRRTGSRRRRARNAKNVATPPSTGTTQTTRSRARRRFSHTASAPYPVSTSSQSSSEPSCPPQNAEIVYGGRERPARVVGDVREREVVSEEAPRRARPPRRASSRTRRRARSARSRPAGADRCARGVAAGDERVDRQPESDEKRCATELGHGARQVALCFGAVLRRALRDQRAGHGDERPRRSAPSTTTSRPTLKRSGTEPDSAPRRSAAPCRCPSS